jgi:NADH-quinone oxidoreductase subunit M
MIAALVLVPLLAGFALYLLPQRAEAAAKWTGVVVALACFIGALVSSNAPDESLPWLHRPFTASFHVGLGNGVSYWIVLLLTLVTMCALIATRVPRQRGFVAQMLLLQGAMTGVFVARDLVLFALFWDLMLIPVFIVLVAAAAPGTRGQHAESSTPWRYLVYNVAGGLALLLATAAYGIFTGSTDVMAAPPATALPLAYAPWVFAGFALAFVVKTPVWPFHTWMPDTYCDLPTPMVAVVSAVQSKAGLYGFMVIGIVLMPAQMVWAAPVMLTLGIVSLLYGALVALTQIDAKRVVAYSSLSHLGLILVALFAFARGGVPDQIALGGAVVYMVAHGLFSAALFLVLGQVEMREETRSLERLGGLGVRNPRLAGALTIAALAALGLPGLAGFAGEILIITGVYQAGYIWASAVVLIPIIIAAAYMLRLLQDTINGPEKHDLPQRPDLTWMEGLSLAPLVIAIVLLGVSPGPLARTPYGAMSPAHVSFLAPPQNGAHK